ncbi:unnamed protein product [Thlaspi arvense]|uniref:Uncharacterized protein n=1 Tax=Thlaspi arvense TaxID=13288 RepID=A0AAU9TC55_THLAR|nr:unnamed protein product [Thlaspi arvense]
MSSAAPDSISGASSGLLDQNSSVKHAPPDNASAALVAACQENPFFLVPQKKSGRKAATSL